MPCAMTVPVLLKTSTSMSTAVSAHVAATRIDPAAVAVTLYQSSSTAGRLQMAEVTLVGVPAVGNVTVRAAAGPSSCSAASSPVHCALPATHELVAASQTGAPLVVHWNGVVHCTQSKLLQYGVAPLQPLLSVHSAARTLSMYAPSVSVTPSAVSMMRNTEPPAGATNSPLSLAVVSSTRSKHEPEPGMPPVQVDVTYMPRSSFVTRSRT